MIKRKNYFQSQKNKEKLRTCKKEYYQKNKENLIAYRKKYYQENKAKEKTYYKKYYQRKKDALRQYKMLYRQSPSGKKVMTKYKQKHKRQITLQRQQYRQSFQGKKVTKKYYQRFEVKMRHRIRQRNRKLLLSDLTIEIVQKVYEHNIKIFGTLTCIYCFKKLKFGEDSLEHIKPTSKGGKNIFSNLAVACFRCNNSKRDYSLKKWFS